MRRFRLVPPAQLALILGSVAGMLAGMTTVALGGAGSEGRQAGGQVRPLEVSHLPPLLTAPGEDVILAYEAFCIGEREVGDGDACAVEGVVHASADSGRRRVGIQPLAPVLL